MTCDTESVCSQGVRFRLAGVVALALGVSFLGLAGCDTASMSGPRLDGGTGGSAGSAGSDALGADVPVANRPDAPSSNPCPAGAGSKTKGKSEECSCDGECQTGHCADGVCCTSACGEACKACNLPTSLGDCEFVPSGVKPNDPSTCTASTAATCGTDGACDGKGGCRLYVRGTECRKGTCDGDGIAGIMSCDGAGKCIPAAQILCPPYTCDSATNECAIECSTNAQCAAGQECVAQSCGLKLNGAKSMSNAECVSGFSSDGVCCNVSCSGPCVSCNQAGSVGRCKFLEAGQSDPACNAEDRSTCGRTGLCDGFGTCTLFPEDTVCRTATCSGEVLLNTAQTCDGLGTCRDAQLTDCSPYRCGSGACNPTCATDADCAPGIACAPDSSGKLSCGKKQNGQSCSDSGECGSGQCVDGVCCESSCTGPCRSCALSGSPGRCVEVASGSPDPRKSCRDDGPATCGTNGLCDGIFLARATAVAQTVGSSQELPGRRPRHLRNQRFVRRQWRVPEISRRRGLRARNLRRRFVYAPVHVQCLRSVHRAAFAQLRSIPVQRGQLLQHVHQRRPMRLGAVLPEQLVRTEAARRAMQRRHRVRVGFLRAGCVLQQRMHRSLQDLRPIRLSGPVQLCRRRLARPARSMPGDRAIDVRHHGDMQGRRLCPV